MTTFQVAASHAPVALPSWLRRLAAALAAPRRAAPARQSLDKGATAWFVRPLGRHISCEAGTLWLAFDGEPQDIVLEAGESHLCTKGTPLSIHALSPATLRVS
jgi:hypothetical protein